MKNTPVRLLHNFFAVFVIAYGSVQPSAVMADLIALKLPGITGDVTVAGYQGTIEVLSLTGDIDRSVSIGSGTTGAGAGPATFGDLMIHSDLTVPRLRCSSHYLAQNLFPTRFSLFCSKRGLSLGKFSR
jgi:hypothetical protein